MKHVVVYDLGVSSDMLKCRLLKSLLDDPMIDVGAVEKRAEHAQPSRLVASYSNLRGRIYVEWISGEKSRWTFVWLHFHTHTHIYIYMYTQLYIRVPEGLGNMVLSVALGPETARPVFTLNRRCWGLA